MAIYGKGIYEKGKHVSKINGKHTKEYLVWRTMISRCYNPQYLEKHPTYEKVEVCSEWLYFQNFCEWFENNYYTIKNEIIDLDKDFICSINNIENKIYSPDTCIFIPQEINKLLVFQSRKTLDLPVGVKRNGNKYNAVIVKKIFNEKCENKKKEIFLGNYDTPEQAYEVYYKNKNEYILYVLEYYKDYIPKNVYNIIFEFVNKDCLRNLHKKQEIILN